MSSSGNNLEVDHNTNSDQNVIIEYTSLDTDQNIGVSDGEGLRILYITLAIIVALLCLWLFIVIFTKEDPITVLNEMTNITAQLRPVTDIVVDAPVGEYNSAQYSPIEVVI